MTITEKRAAEIAEQIERGEIEFGEPLPEDQWPEVLKRGPGRPSLAEGRSPQITIRVSRELRDRAAERAEAEGVKVSDVTRRALEEYLGRRAS